MHDRFAYVYCTVLYCRPTLTSKHYRNAKRSLVLHNYLNDPYSVHTLTLLGFTFSKPSSRSLRFYNDVWRLTCPILCFSTDTSMRASSTDYCRCVACCLFNQSTCINHRYHLENWMAIYVIRLVMYDRHHWRIKTFVGLGPRRRKYGGWVWGGEFPFSLVV